MHRTPTPKEVTELTIYIAISIVLAFFIPILSASVVEKIVNKEPYTVPLIAISLFLSFIVATLCLFAQ